MGKRKIFSVIQARLLLDRYLRLLLADLLSPENQGKFLSRPARAILKLTGFTNPSKGALSPDERAAQLRSYLETHYKYTRKLRRSSSGESDGIGWAQFDSLLNGAGRKSLERMLARFYRYGYGSGANSKSRYDCADEEKENLPERLPKID